MAAAARILRCLDEYLRIAMKLIGFMFVGGFFLLMVFAGAAFSLNGHGFGPWVLFWALFFAVGGVFPAWCALKAGTARGSVRAIAWRIPVYAALAGWGFLFAQLAEAMLLLLLSALRER